MKNANLLKRAVCMGIVVCLSTTLAHATPFVTVTLAGNDPTDGSGHQAVGFTAYIISVITDNGALIRAIDAGGPNGDTTALTNGIFGPMLQRWDINAGVHVPSPAKTDTFNPAVTYSPDSHFLLADALMRADVVPPQEDNTSINPPGSPADFTVDFGGGNVFGYDYGTGTKLQATFGLKAAIQSNNIALAYVVLPTGVFGSYSLNVLTDDPGPASSNFFLSGVVPEPALSPVLLGGLGFLLRRRRASAGA